MTSTRLNSALARPANIRELRLMAAGSCAGSRNVYMTMAAKSHSRSERRELVKLARQFHHMHMAALREAQEATFGEVTSYYAAQFVEGGLSKRQAG